MDRERPWQRLQAGLTSSFLACRAARTALQQGMGLQLRLPSTLQLCTEGRGADIPHADACTLCVLLSRAPAPSVHPMAASYVAKTVHAATVRVNTSASHTSHTCETDKGAKGPKVQLRARRPHLQQPPLLC